MVGWKANVKVRVELVRAKPDLALYYEKGVEGAEFDVVEKTWIIEDVKSRVDLIEKVKAKLKEVDESWDFANIYVGDELITQIENS